MKSKSRRLRQTAALVDVLAARNGDLEGAEGGGRAAHSNLVRPMGPRRRRRRAKESVDTVRLKKSNFPPLSFGAARPRARAHALGGGRLCANATALLISRRQKQLVVG